MPLSDLSVKICGLDVLFCFPAALATDRSRLRVTIRVRRASVLNREQSYNVSVVIPTYNRLGVLPRALDSVFGQTLPPFEVLVVDDGSTDGTSDWVRNHYPQVKVIEQPNQGVSAARNTGIRESNAEWLAFLDSDDAWLTKKLESQVQALAEAPEMRLCHTEEIWIRNGKRVNQMKKHQKSGGWIFERCLELCCISPSSVMLKRDLLEALGGFDESLPACEDYDLWLQICAREPVLYLPTPLINKYGGHDDQLSRLHPAMDRFRIQALEKIAASSDIEDDKRHLARLEIKKRLEILILGARKRGNTDWLNTFEMQLGRVENALNTEAPA